MGLIFEVQGVYHFLRELFTFLPIAVKLLIVGVPGTLIFLSILRAVR